MLAEVFEHDLTPVFGAMHVYQGWIGVVRTALRGGVLAGGFLASGSLWPPRYSGCTRTTNTSS